MVGLNKTKTRNSLALDGTLLSVMTVLYVGVLYPCHQASKCATNIYNRKKETKLKTIISISFCDIDTIDKNYEISMVEK